MKTNLVKLNLSKLKSLALAISLLGSTAVNAAVVDIVAGISTYNTTGADMTGMTVRAFFNDNTNQLQTWGASGPASSGGAFGTAWSLTLAGDSNFTNWVFTNETQLKLTRLELDGSTGLTVFDIDQNAVGTPNTDIGLMFDAYLTLTDPTVLSFNATYANMVAISGSPAVGDIFHKLNVDFGLGGIGGNFLFSQDTDSVSAVPLPAAVWFLGSGLLGLAGFARRSSSVGA